MLTQIYLATRFFSTSNKHQVGSFAAMFTEKAVENHAITMVYKNTSENRVMLHALIQSINYINENNLEGNFIFYSKLEYVVNGLNEWIFEWKKEGLENCGKQNLDLWIKLDKIFDRKRMAIKHRMNIDNICYRKLSVLCDHILNLALDGEIPYKKDIGVKP